MLKCTKQPYLISTKDLDYGLIGKIKFRLLYKIKTVLVNSKLLKFIKN